MIEILNTVLHLKGHGENREVANFFAGGCEIYKDGVRLPDTGWSFFRYYVNGSEKTFNFPELPPYLMIPFREPDRIEFYMPPRSKTINFPIVFTFENLFEQELSDDELFEKSMRSGKLLEQKTIIFRKKRFHIEDGRITIIRKKILSDTAILQGDYMFWKPLKEEGSVTEWQPPLWSSFEFYRTNPFLLWLKGGYSLNMIHSSQGLTATQFLKQIKFTLNDIKYHSLNKHIIFKVPFDSNYQMDILFYGEKLKSFMWLSLPLDEKIEIDTDSLQKIILKENGKKRNRLKFNVPDKA